MIEIKIWNDLSNENRPEMGNYQYTVQVADSKSNGALYDYNRSWSWKRLVEFVMDDSKIEEEPHR